MPRLPPQLDKRSSEGSGGPLEHLAQIARISELDELGQGEWTTLYEYQSDANGSRCTYSGLLSAEAAGATLDTTDWDVSIGDGTPGFSVSYTDGKEITAYDGTGFRSAEPILYVRNFHGMKPDQFDLSEEFRLFHNLYHDKINDRFVHFDDRGREEVACEIKPGRTRVLTKLLRQYMAARQLTLALFFDHRAEVDSALKLGGENLKDAQIKLADRCYSFNTGSLSPNRVFSRLVGKKIIAPDPVDKSGVWPFKKKSERKFEDFIIGVANDGASVLSTCNPDDLANYFGANEDAPHYLTPVWFSKVVLSKYYDDSSKFSVEDGYLRCGSLWGIQIDNDLPDHVVVFLGDLGRDLDWEEQRYWRHYNVTPGERQQSATSFKRSFMAQFSDPAEPDLVFKREYTHVNELWEKAFGWPLFRPLHASDAHIFTQFRIPITESFGEFEGQLIALTKLMVDSLNESEIARKSGGSVSDEKGISKFERLLVQQKYPHVERDIALLRSIQGLRSTGAAHAKGERFDKVAASVGLGRSSPRDVFREFLVRVNKMFESLSEHFGS